MDKQLIIRLINPLKKPLTNKTVSNIGWPATAGFARIWEWRNFSKVIDKAKYPAKRRSKFLIILLTSTNDTHAERCRENYR